jgi:hypothetical protein
MIYPYRCVGCGPFLITKEMCHAGRPEPCPNCGNTVSGQDYSAKQIGGYVSTESNWSGGKMIPQLPANHPDYMVTSQRQMERVYKENGISMDTGHFVSEKAQIEATVPQNKRTKAKANVTGGVQPDA